MLEQRIESATTQAVAKAGGWAPKWTSPGNPGVPDRIVLLPGGRIVFVELKAPGKKPTALQAKIHDRLRALGFEVRVIDSLEDARAVVL